MTIENSLLDAGAVEHRYNDYEKNHTLLKVTQD